VFKDPFVVNQHTPVWAIADAAVRTVEGR